MTDEQRQAVEKDLIAIYELASVHSDEARSAIQERAQQALDTLAETPR